MCLREQGERCSEEVAQDGAKDGTQDTEEGIAEMGRHLRKQRSSKCEETWGGPRLLVPEDAPL